MNPILTALAKGIKKSGTPPAMVSVPSDIPFKPEAVKKLGVDYFYTIRGRSVAFGTGMKLANPALKIVPFVGDLMTLGGNHTVHAGRRNMELTVLCVNNFVYRDVGGKKAPERKVRFSPYSTFEQPFNVPHLANSCGALFTARWTALHTDELAESIAEGLGKNGFSVIEVLYPGPDFYTDIDDVDADLLDFYHENSVVKNGEEPKNVVVQPDRPHGAGGRFENTDRGHERYAWSVIVSSPLIEAALGPDGKGYFGIGDYDKADAKYNCRDNIPQITATYILPCNR